MSLARTRASRGLESTSPQAASRLRFLTRNNCTFIVFEGKENLIIEVKEGFASGFSHVGLRQADSPPTSGAVFPKEGPALQLGGRSPPPARVHMST